MDARTRNEIEQLQQWQDAADKNIEKWGQQPVETLLLAIQEEVGELSQATLEYKHEDGYYGDIFDELDDLAPLLIQLRRSLGGHNFLEVADKCKEAGR